MMNKKTEWSARQIEILRAAREVLIEEGYPAFTLRRVANRARMHMKTLQHYFSSKGVLLLETMTHTLEELYFSTYETISNEIENRSPEDALSCLLEFLIADCKKYDTCRFFLELWALASRDEDACEALDSLYTRHRKRLEGFIERANPHIAEDVVKLRAAVIAEQIEGLILFIGYGKPRHPEFDDMEIEVHKKFMEYALSP